MRAAVTAPARRVRGKGAEPGMGRIWKALLLLVLLGLVGLVGYAYFGDLTPESRDVNEPVTLDVD